MNLVLADLGERLQQFRRSLELSQKDLASTLKVGQNQISRLENGLGGSIDLLLLLVNYYTTHFDTSYLLAEHFEVVRRDDAASQKNPYASIALERVKLLKSEFNEQVDKIMEVMEHS